jgi:sulfoxide reductase catalytic subunit YedY
MNMLWLVNCLAFYALLFATDQWVRLIPMTWDVIPHAASTALQYASLNFPAETDWTRYNSLQQLTYFFTVFIAAPTSIVTGLMQGPAISNRLGWFGKVFNRQIARSVHFLSFLWFLGFIAIHGALVFLTGLRRNTNHMFAGVDDATWSGLLPFLAAMAILAVCWAISSPLTIRHARRVQKIGRFMLGWLKGWMETGDPTAQLTEQDISPHFWPNGTMPASAEYQKLADENFAGYRLRIGGLVEQPCDFSLAELKAMPRHEQITTHFCIQGWSGVAKWGGVRMSDLNARVRPLPSARYAVFYSLADGSDG